jgi:hypothetical protein
MASVPNARLIAERGYPAETKALTYDPARVLREVGPDDR